MKQVRYVQEDNPYKRYSFSSIAALLVGTAMFFLSCENKIERIKELSTTDPLPDMVAENFEMIESDSAVIKFRLNTPLMIQYNQNENAEEAPYTEFPKGVKIEQFGKNLQIVSQITSNYAQYFEREGKYVAKNNVVVINEKGDTLRTEELTWERKTGKIYSDKFVRITGKDQNINGIGFQSDENMANWQIKKIRQSSLYLEVPE